MGEIMNTKRLEGKKITDEKMYYCIKYFQIIEYSCIWIYDKFEIYFFYRKLYNKIIYFYN